MLNFAIIRKNFYYTGCFYPSLQKWDTYENDNACGWIFVGFL